MEINALNGIHNFLVFVNDNWMLITTIIGLALALYKKIKDYLLISTEEKIKIAKAQISEIMLKLVTEAEVGYKEWTQAGSIKRSQVIDEIFAMYPILSKVTNQKELISWIDDTIDIALKEMRKIFEENKNATAQAGAVE